MLISDYLSSNIIICILFFIYFREVGQKYRNIFVRFLVQMKSSKSHSEIIWTFSTKKSWMVSNQYLLTGASTKSFWINDSLASDISSSSWTADKFGFAETPGPIVRFDIKVWAIVAIAGAGCSGGIWNFFDKSYLLFVFAIIAISHI